MQRALGGHVHAPPVPSEVAPTPEDLPTKGVPDSTDRKRRLLDALVEEIDKVERTSISKKSKRSAPSIETLLEELDE
jgi:hypothetical protein